MSATTVHRVSLGAESDQVDQSCRGPLVALFTGAAVWLVLSSILALIASIKFHSPDFLAGSAWLTYGRVRPAASVALSYGFAMPCGLALGLWLMARLGRALLSGAVTIVFGTLLWNLGIAVAIGGVLLGDVSGFHHLEFPAYASVLLFLGYVVIAVPGILTFRRRAPGPLFVSQWFVLAALFWFPWIFSTAMLLLQVFPGRGMTQAVIAWWYSANLSLVWFGLIGLATAFYLLPRITGRELSSHYLSLFVFWILILFGSWTGIPSSAPVPAWMPVLSNVGTVLMLLGLIGLLLVVHQTLDGRYGLLAGQNSLRFTAVGLLAFMLVILMGVVEAFAGPGSVLQLTWFGNAKAQLSSYGFPAMVLFAGTYFILPRLVDDGLRFPKLERVQFWLAATGIALVVIPFAIAGFVESAKLAQPEIAFVDVSKSMLMFIRISTIGDLLILIANGLFLLNVAGTVLRYYRVQLQAGFSAVTIEASAEGVRS